MKNVKCKVTGLGTSCTSTKIYSTTATANCCYTNTTCGASTCVTTAWNTISKALTTCDCTVSIRATRCSLTTTYCEDNSPSTCFVKKGGYCTKTITKNGSSTCPGTYSSGSTASCKPSITCKSICDTDNWTYGGSTGTVDPSNGPYFCPCTSINSGNSKSKCWSSYIVCSAAGGGNSSGSCVAKKYTCSLTITTSIYSTTAACTGAKTATNTATCNVSSVCTASSCA